MKVAVIQFPGSNREDDAAKALNALNALDLDAELFRWNLDSSLGRYYGIVLPGGFSYQDRVRSGVIAAKEHIMYDIREEAEKGKPIIGICNGCQILVEAGLVPQIYEYRIDLGMAPNAGKQDGKTVRTGFDSDWVYNYSYSRERKMCSYFSFRERRNVSNPYSTL